MAKLSIPETTAESIMEVVEALSKRKGNINYLCQYTDKSEVYINRCISLGINLGLIQNINETNYEITGQCKSISKLFKQDSKSIFSSALNKFEPYVYFISLIRQGNTLEDSIRKVKAVFEIDTSDRIVKKVFKNFSRFIGIKETDISSINEFLGNEDDTHQISNILLESLKDEFSIAVFLSEKLGENCYKFLENPEKSLIIKSLLKYKQEPSNAISDFAGSLESFLRRIGKSNGIDLASSNGIGQIAQVLASKSNKIILPEHRGLCEFVGTFRNPSSHKVQKNIVKHWKIYPDSSLEIILLGLSSIRSIYEYVFNYDLVL